MYSLCTNVRKHWYITNLSCTNNVHTVTLFKFQTRNPGKLLSIYIKNPSTQGTTSSKPRIQGFPIFIYRTASFLHTTQTRKKEKKAALKYACIFQKRARTQECVTAENNPKSKKRTETFQPRCDDNHSPKKIRKGFNFCVLSLFPCISSFKAIESSDLIQTQVESIVSYGFATLFAILFLKPCSWNNNQVNQMNIKPKHNFKKELWEWDYTKATNLVH